MQKIFSSTTAASGKTLNTSWNCRAGQRAGAGGAGGGKGQHGEASVSGEDETLQRKERLLQPLLARERGQRG